MSDYGDEDYIEFDDDWFYVEDEYTAADDLAEHAVGSPPPPNCLDEEDPTLNWDRFDYFNDLEYASDGYDDAKFEPHRSGHTSQNKRKRVGDSRRNKKVRKLNDRRSTSPSVGQPVLPPVVWRAQADREEKPRIIHDGLEPYALLKDWRVRLASVPTWASASPRGTTAKGKAKATDGSELGPNDEETKELEEEDLVEEDEDNEEDDEEDGGAGIDAAALMASLQKNLAAAGGPLSGMDPEQLLQFAMRMMNDQDAGDDIAGELADDMLNQGDGDEDGETESADLLSWLARQKEGSATANSAGPKSKNEAPRSKSPLSKPSQDTLAAEDQMELDDSDAKGSRSLTNNGHNTRIPPQEASRKRKADEDVDATASTATARKRAARSFDAPTASSQAKTTRSGRVRR
ncbi:hypothetical protein BU24DRAFT_181013 [Aaosphaeria arxii CBS 175.79]|uniref:Uncharacterized protein n=1 Tax=Aaosphaeria arxii CBS 175.79 TaxID=1450172 RepID=A0A6A5XQY7_9PLEO|nr:uncharacterized protein BU24DRAFT_181013 [Aaosphaeria arxii CBS 175.79]KAF2015592.1 hypothetical protein BU24DRAFT_181013 [Aaosphaeria arxii CBS 175.79]